MIFVGYLKMYLVFIFVVPRYFTKSFSLSEDRLSELKNPCQCRRSLPIGTYTVGKIWSASVMCYYFKKPYFHPFECWRSYLVAFGSNS